MSASHASEKMVKSALKKKSMLFFSFITGLSEGVFGFGAALSAVRQVGRAPDRNGQAEQRRG